MDSVHLQLLGAFALHIHGELVTDFRSDRARAILAYVAGDPDQLHPREELAALFWPDLGDAQAKANLRNVLSNLRGIFAALPDSPLTITRRHVRFQANPAQVDLLAFAALLAQAQSTTVARIDLLQRAVRLYSGDFLAGFSLDAAPDFDEWRTVRQERYHHQAMQALESIATHLAAAGDHEGLAECARRQLRLEPWHEPAHRRLIQALAARGMQTAALEQYERCVEVLARELGLAPDPETAALVQRIRGEDSAGTGRPSPQPVRNNIPLVNTSFLGRGPELTALTEDCRPGERRLITLLGMGGVGKSRLAVAVGQQIAPRFQDGVCWVSLEGVPPGDNVANRLVVAVAAGLDLPLGGSASVLEQLLDYLEPRQMLLILDNFEQLVAGADLLLALLRGAPRISLLVTSRQRLHLPGEHPVLVRGLPTAAGTDLFVSRAQAVAAEFALTSENREAIERICALVEGLPLGIELAAVWVEHFTCGEIAGSIATDRTLLARQPGEDLSGERHDSLLTVYEHSWRMLSAGERQALAHLSIFRGEFSRVAVLTIAAAGLSELSGLLAKSLVRLVGAGRYTLHEVVRTFSGQKLAQLSPAEQAAIQGRHHTYYLGRLLDQPILALQQDLENIRAAWLSAATARDYALLTQATSHFTGLLHSLGLLQDGMDLLQMALVHVLADEGEAGWDGGDCGAAILAEISATAKITASLDASLEAAQRGLAYTDDPRLRIRLYNNIAGVMAETKEWPAAIAIYDQMAAEAERSGDPQLIAQVLYKRASDRVLHFVGDYTESIRELEHALALITGDESDQGPMDAERIYLQASILDGLAMGNIRFGNYTAALDYAAQLQTLAEEENQRFEQIGAAILLGLASCFAGLHEEGIAHTTEGLSIAEEIGDHEGAALLRANLCLVHRAAGNLDQAVAYGESALPPLARQKNRRIEGLCRNRLGHALLAQGRHAEAEAMYAQAVAVWDQLDSENRFEAVAGRAVALLHLGQGEEAEGLVEAVLDFAVGDALLRVVEPVQMLLHCAQVLQSSGQPDRARAILRQAQDWTETITSRNADAAVRHAYLYNIPAHQQVRLALASDSFILGTM